MTIILEVLKYVKINVQYIKRNNFLVLKTLKGLWSQTFQTRNMELLIYVWTCAVEGVHRDASDYSKYVNRCKHLHRMKTAAWWCEETLAAIGSQPGAAMMSHLVIVHPGEDTGWHEWARRPTLKPWQHVTEQRQRSRERETGGETRGGGGVCHRSSRCRHWFGAQRYGEDGFGWSKRLNLQENGEMFTLY